MNIGAQLQRWVNSRPAPPPKRWMPRVSSSTGGGRYFLTGCPHCGEEQYHKSLARPAEAPALGPMLVFCEGCGVCTTAAILGAGWSPYGVVQFMTHPS